MRGALREATGTGGRGPVAVLAPHPDDETIAAFGLIGALRRRGVPVAVIVVTDGRGSHYGSPTWSAARLVRARRRETIRAMRGLGVGRGALVFLNLRDRELDPADRRQQETVVRAVRRVAPRLLIAPSEHDAHGDHRAVAAFARAAIKDPRRRWRYAVWRLPRGFRERRELPYTAPALAFRKRAALRRYATQNGLIRDAREAFFFSGAELRQMSRPVERFARQ